MWAKPQRLPCGETSKVFSDVSRDNQKVESENRPARTASEPTREGDSGTEEAPSDATQTASGRVYRSSEKWRKNYGERLMLARADLRRVTLCL